MPITVEKLKREFHFDKNGTKVKLSDPNPEFNIDEVRNFYSGQYPALLTAIFEEPKQSDGKLIFNVTTSIGTNG